MTKKVAFYLWVPSACVFSVRRKAFHLLICAPRMFPEEKKTSVHDYSCCPFFPLGFWTSLHVCSGSAVQAYQGRTQVGRLIGMDFCAGSDCRVVSPLIQAGTQGCTSTQYFLWGMVQPSPSNTAGGHSRAQLQLRCLKRLSCFVTFIRTSKRQFCFCWIWHLVFVYWHKM